MTIHKYFETQKQAEEYYLTLCGIYNSVKLVGFPMFGESGNYSFLVKD
jgi:hypothetical protein